MASNTLTVVRAFTSLHLNLKETRLIASDHSSKSRILIMFLVKTNNNKTKHVCLSWRWFS